MSEAPTSGVDMSGDRVSTIPQRLREVMALDPSAPALEFDGAWSTWGELSAAADAVDEVLRACHLGAGAPVGLMLRNRPVALGTLLGLLRAGACVVTVNPLLGAERLRADLPGLGLPLLLGSPDDLALVAPEILPVTARGGSVRSRRRSTWSCPPTRSPILLRSPTPPGWRCACSRAARPVRPSASTCATRCSTW